MSDNSSVVMADLDLRQAMRDGYDRIAARYARWVADGPIDTIVAFDGLAVGQYMVPKLTSVGVPWYRVALVALEALISLMQKNRPQAAPSQQFEPQLVPGESVIIHMSALPVPARSFCTTLLR
jgi:Periplasmic binding protein-like domain